MSYRDRIKEVRRVKSGELHANPMNWRLHPTKQKRALKSALEEIGQVGVLLARETPEGLELIDGHCRAELDREQEWSVAILDVDDEEAKKILASFDPIGDLAGKKAEVVSSLLASMTSKSSCMDLLERDSAIDFQEPPSFDQDKSEPVRVVISFPPRVWLLNREAIAESINTLASEFGGVVDA